ncbi:MerR family transcriptional regulator [Micromonospora sp. CPCC 206061]|uniref:MerR family transcriptional regulator n=1 Tax=Micromonospora sp. CPCC 206061 TaxID=3122410 RepID=UPI002FF3C1A9
MDDDYMDDQSERWQIGQFAELVGLSIPQLRRYDRQRLLEPDGREVADHYGLTPETISVDPQWLQPRGRS